MALSPVMQIRRMMRLGSSRDVSIGQLLVIVIGFAFWIAYGIAIRNPALVVPGVVSGDDRGQAGLSSARRTTTIRTDPSGAASSWR